MYLFLCRVFDHLPTLASPLVEEESEAKEASSDGAILSFASGIHLSLNSQLSVVFILYYV